MFCKHTWFLVAYTSLLLRFNDAAYECSQPYECVGNVILDSTEAIQCSGFYSCQGATMSTANDATIDCAGSYACYQANNLVSDAVTNCDGFYSCKEATIVSGSYTICYGEQSCQAADISFDTSNSASGNGYLYCYGERSCSDATISAVNILASGNGALQGSTITPSENELSIRFDSYLAGSGTTIQCPADANCNIECHASGCNGLVLDCDDSATCSVDCDDSETNNLCPNGYDPTYSYQVSTLSDESEQLALLCNDTTNTNAVRCLEKQECETSNVGPASSGQPICCSGDEACAEATRISNDGGDILCDGSEACEEAESISTSGSQMILCTGDKGCQDSVISGARLVSCGGYESCTESEMDGFNEIHCGARKSCYDSVIQGVEGSVFGLGSESLAGGTSISNVLGNVYALAYQAAMSVTIDSVENVYASGYQSLYGATVTNVNDDVYCIGPQSCRDAMLSGMEKVVAYGDLALQAATIIGGEESLFVSISGDNSVIEGTGNGIRIHCNNTETCIIDCLSSNACTDVTVFCDGECTFVSCNEKDDGYDINIACPTQINVGIDSSSGSSGSSGSGSGCSDSSDGGDGGGSGDDSTGVLVTLIIILIIAFLVMIFLLLQEKKKSDRVSLGSGDRGGGNVTLNTNNGVNGAKPEIETDPNTGAKQFATIDQE